MNKCGDRLSLQRVQEIVDEFGVNRNWLLTGDGSIFKDDYNKEDNASSMQLSLFDNTPSTQPKEIAPAPVSNDIDKTIKSLVECNERLTKELVEQGKRMDVLLEILKQKI